MNVKVGDRVKMTGVMRDDPDPIKVGDEGTVDYVFDGGGSPSLAQISVKWDSGRSLMLLPQDPFTVIG